MTGFCIAVSNSGLPQDPKFPSLRRRHTRVLSDLQTVRDLCLSEGLYLPKQRSRDLAVDSEGSENSALL